MAKGNLTITLDEKEWTKAQALLSQLSEVNQNQLIKNAMAKGGAMLKQAGQANLASTDKGTGKGQLKKSFQIRKKSNKKSSYTLVGFKRGPSYKEHLGAFAHMINYGTKIRHTNSGHYTGSISKGAPNTGSEFWSNAVETEGPRALDRIMDAIYDALNDIQNKNS